MLAKAASMLLILASSTLLGVRMANRLRERCDLLKLLDVFFARLLTGMEYRRAPLAELVRNDPACADSALLRYFSEGLQQNAPREAWRAAVDKADSDGDAVCSLTQHDKEILARFIATLGTSNLNTQSGHASLFHSELSEAIAHAGNDFTQKGRLYRSLGVLCGAAMAILLL